MQSMAKEREKLKEKKLLIEVVQIYIQGTRSCSDVNMVSILKIVALSLL